MRLPELSRAPSRLLGRVAFLPACLPPTADIFELSEVEQNIACSNDAQAHFTAVCDVLRLKVRLSPLPSSLLSTPLYSSPRGVSCWPDERPQSPLPRAPLCNIPPPPSPPPPAPQGIDPLDSLRLLMLYALRYERARPDKVRLPAGGVAGLGRKAGARKHRRLLVAAGL